MTRKTSTVLGVVVGLALVAGCGSTSNIGGG